MKEILFQFGLPEQNFQVVPFGNGLINTTWKVMDKESKIYSSKSQPSDL
jgi:hypothetical protein